MALKAILDSLDGLDDSIKSEYVEKDGKYVLDVTPVNGLSLEDVAPLKEKVSELNGKLSDAISTRDKAKEKLTKFGDADPEEIAKLTEFHNKWKDVDPEKESDKIAEEKAKVLLHEREQQILKKHNEEKDALSGDNKKLMTQLEKALIGSEITQAVTKHKGNPKLLAPVIRNNVEMAKTEDGDFQVHVLDDKGTVRLTSKSGSTDNMSIEEYVAELAESDDFAGAFEGSGGSGFGGGEDPKGGKRRPGSTKTITAAEARDGSYNDKIASGEVVVTG